MSLDDDVLAWELEPDGWAAGATTVAFGATSVLQRLAEERTR